MLFICQMMSAASLATMGYPVMATLAAVAAVSMWIVDLFDVKDRD